jgi:hypothetical protein
VGSLKNWRVLESPTSRLFNLQITPTPLQTFSDPDVSNMPPPDEIFANWRGLVDNNILATIRTTFELPSEDNYVYRAESFAMTLRHIEEQVHTSNLRWKYQAHGQQIEVSSVGGCAVDSSIN